MACADFALTAGETGEEGAPLLLASAALKHLAAYDRETFEGEGGAKLKICCRDVARTMPHSKLV